MQNERKFKVPSYLEFSPPRIVIASFAYYAVFNEKDNPIFCASDEEIQNFFYAEKQNYLEIYQYIIFLNGVSEQVTNTFERLVAEDMLKPFWQENPSPLIVSKRILPVYWAISEALKPYFKEAGKRFYEAFKYDNFGERGNISKLENRLPKF